MKKLLQINSLINAGSTGRIAEEIGGVAISRGWKSYIAYGRNPRSSQSQLIKIGHRMDILLHVLTSRLFDRHGFGSKRATKKFIKEIKKINPDVIALHNVHGYYLNIELLFNFLKEFKKPVIWTLFDCWAFTGHCSYFESVDCKRWIEGCYQCPLTSAYPQSWLIDNSKNNYLQKKELFTGIDNLTIVVHSAWLAGLVKKSFLQHYPVKVINNGVNLSIFKPSKKDVKNRLGLNGEFVILGIAHIWTPRKGLSDLIDLSKRLTIDEKIVLVGLSKDQMKQLPSNIIGLEKTENVEELVELYSSADVFINPTWEDNFPTTNLEALACGTPVITYRTGGSPEAINEDTGFVVNKGDINGLLKSLTIIKTKKKEHFYSACVSRANTLFNNKERYNEFIDLC